MASEIMRFLIMLFLLIDFSAMLLIAGTIIAVMTMGTVDPFLKTEKTEEEDNKKPLTTNKKPEQPKLRRVAIF